MFPIKQRSAPPTVECCELSDGSAMYLPHSDQVIFYDKSGWQISGYDWTEEYFWVVTGDQVPPEELCNRMLAEFKAKQPGAPISESASTEAKP